MPGCTSPRPRSRCPTRRCRAREVTHHGDIRPFGLIVGTGGDEFLVIGRELTLDFFAADARVEIDSVVELLLDGREVVEGRVLNGDERLMVLPSDRVGAARIRLLRL